MADAGNGGSNTAPGWYPDGSGRTRFWDGSAWTEQYQDAPPPGAAAMGAPMRSGNPKADAKAAKAYAKASRPWFKKKRWWLAGAALLLIIAVASTSGGGDDGPETASDSNDSSTDSGAGDTTSDSADDSGDSGNSGDEDAPAEEKPEKVLKVSAAQILKDFEDNEAAADGKYKGKRLQVDGVVEKVDTELLDDSEYVVQISDGGDFAFLTVNCDDQSADDVASLKKGDDIVVVADFEDGGDLGVELKDCTIS